jgi:crossover junction endodeoxyribonuclease RuvC
MTVLGLDLSLNGSAFAVIDVQDGVSSIVDTVLVNNKKVKTHGEKLLNIAMKLDETIRKHDIERIARERGFTRHNKATQALYKVVGVVDYVLAIHGIYECDEIAPTTVKKELTGDGRASKEDVERAVREYIKEKDFVFETDDVSDAVAVAITKSRRSS